MSESLSRRDALRRVGAAGLATAGVVGLGAWLHGRPGWPPPANLASLPSWHLVDDGPKLAIARGSSPTRLVEDALEALGGLTRFVRPGDRVLVKPNAAFDRPAWQGTTANPEVVGTVVRLCVKAGAAEVIVTDNPIHAPEGCFRKTGIGQAVEDAGGRVLLPRPQAFRAVALPGTVLDRWPVYAEPLLNATKLIGIAPAKDHNLAKASLTMKNWYGMLGGARNRLHQKMDETIASLVDLIRPTLSIVDGTRVLIRNGPTGGSPDDVVRKDVLAIATDPVAADAFGATLLDLLPGDLAYLGMAEARGLGTTDWQGLLSGEGDE